MIDCENNRSRHVKLEAGVRPIRRAALVLVCRQDIIWAGTLVQYNNKSGHKGVQTRSGCKKYANITTNNDISDQNGASCIGERR